MTTAVSSLPSPGARPRQQLRYLDRTRLLLFVASLVAVELLHVAVDVTALGTPWMRAGGALLAAAMLYDMWILSGAWSRPSYALHHAVSAAVGLVEVLHPESMQGTNAGIFIAFLLLGATTKRLRILRNWHGPHDDAVERLLVRAYSVLGKADLVVVPVFAASFVAVKVVSSAEWLPALLVAATLLLLAVRIKLA